MRSKQKKRFRQNSLGIRIDQINVILTAVHQREWWRIAQTLRAWRLQLRLIRVSCDDKSRQRNRRKLGTRNARLDARKSHRWRQSEGNCFHFSAQEIFCSSGQIDDNSRVILRLGMEKRRTVAGREAIFHDLSSSSNVRKLFLFHYVIWIFDNL